MTKRRPADPDPRAAELTEEALGCRANGGHHSYEPLPKALRRAAKLGTTAGSIMVERFCVGNCGVSTIEEYGIRSRERVTKKPAYPKEGYLMPKDSGGRMHSADALASLLSRVFE